MLITKVKSTIEKYCLLEKGDGVVVGVSGGADSLSLLHILNAIKKEFGLKLYVAHLDHMLRKGSIGDRKFVVREAEKLGIPVIWKEINIKKLADKGSIEEICRNKRLDFLFEAAKKFRADKIALGHNLDDQAETVIMRILRGSGLYGLSGILPKRKLYGFTIIRPLLEVKRKEIEAYVKRKKIKPRVDHSNFQDIYLRNKIRNKLLPVLEKNYNNNIKQVLSNTAENIAQDYDFLNQACVAAAKRLGRNINLKQFSKLHIAVQRMVVRLKINRLKGNTRGITFKHIQEIEDLILTRPINSLVDLPGNISVKKTGQNLIFYRR